MSYEKQILQLRDEGKSYTEIMKIVGVSRSTVCYHCADGQKLKSSDRRRKNRNKKHPYHNKMFKFLENRYQNQELVISKFTAEDVITKFGENPKCYLTGIGIDIYKPETYHFDHIIPISKGGSNTIDNLGICTREANLAKRDLSLEDFIALCKQVINYQK